MEEEWRQLLSEVLHETARTTEEVALMLERLKRISDYGEIHNLWVSGTPTKQVKQMLRTLFWQMGFRKEP